MVRHTSILIRILYLFTRKMSKEEYYKILKEQNKMFSECIRYLIRAWVIWLSLIMIAYAIW